MVYVEEPDPAPDAFPTLDQFGHWVYVSDAGWAWRPTVQQAWRPFYHGHWAYSDFGWTWVSYEPFGWAVYHYGDWARDPRYGWLWFPDYEWQPHRATWVVYRDHIAWAPTPHVGYYVGDPWKVEYEYAWTVIHVMDFTNQYIGDYHVHNFRPRVHKDPRYIITRAPEPTYIYQRTGRQVVKIHINTRPVMGHKKGLKRIYLPAREEVRLTKHKTRARKELYGKGRGYGKPTPMTRPGDDRHVVTKEKKTRWGKPIPMTRPEFDDTVPQDDGQATKKTGKDKPTPMTRPGKDTKISSDGPIIITPSDELFKRQTRQGKKDDKGVKDDDSKDNRKDKENKDKKDDKESKEDKDKKGKDKKGGDDDDDDDDDDEKDEKGKGKGKGKK